MTKKSISIIFAALIATVNISADDTYELRYKDKNCSLTKNSVSIPLIDPRFGEQKPNFAYTCNAVQKEQYNYCEILNSENTTALLFAYGAYDNTNHIMAFKNPHKSVESSLKVKCTKEFRKNK